ncbi:MAG TPA: DUF2760 domain-containing protein [Bryobacteraceae bacterium]|nr:DUF2760 domain-containing protein [Bryobacteraceae bacterium]
MNRIGLAFRSFFALLFGGALSDELIRDLGLVKREAVPPPRPTPPPAPLVRTSDGALQMVAILQRDSRLIDFLMEDISGYADDQIGAAVRELHDQCRDSLTRYIKLEPVIDGVEGTYAKAPSKDPNLVKFVGNVPAKPPEGGTLRHRGWRASKIDLPTIGAKQDAAVVAPAEIEIE